MICGRSGTVPIGFATVVTVGSSHADVAVSGGRWHPWKSSRGGRRDREW